VGYTIDWDTAAVHVTQQARLVLTVRVVADPALILLGEAEPNPVWRKSFSRLAAARRGDWQTRQLHWGTPEVSSDGTVTMPIESSTSEAVFVRGELDDLAKKAGEHADGEWERLKAEARELTHLIRPGA
jgi:hypothetical protein